MVSGPQVAHAVLELNPLRLGYSLLSDKNLIMRGVAQAANDASAERVPASADNPFLAIQQQFSEAMVYALNLFRDARDEYVERSFHTFYGSPLVQAACGISSNDAPRPRPGLLPSVLAATQAEKRRLRGRMAEGDVFDAAARVLVYICRAQHRIDKRTFEALRKRLLAYPEISPAGFKAALRDQWTILALDERAAIEALPALLPADVRGRHYCADLLQTTVAATGKLSADGERRLKKVLQLLAEGTEGDRRGMNGRSRCSSRVPLQAWGFRGGLLRWEEPHA